MKSLRYLFLAVFAALTQVHGTEQESDYIIYQGDRCELETHWLFPSPLQVYFIADESRETPFESTSTANHRGHIATWELSENRLYLTSLSHSDRIRPEEDDARPQAENAKARSDKLIRKVFPKLVNDDGKVFADWFSGNLRVFSKPVKRQYKETDDDEGYELTEFTEITLLQVDKGKVVRETNFPVDLYWAKFNTYLQYRKLDPGDVAAMREHIGFIDKHSEGWEEIGLIEPEGPMHTEKDFSVFLSRRLSRDVRIPLTDFAIVEDATINFSETGYIIGSDLRIEPRAHLLFLEMGAVGVPLGPWSPHTGGSVQLVIQIGNLESRTLKFSEADEGDVKMINNFAGALNPKKKVDGTLQVRVLPTSEVVLSGTIRLTSEDPSTFQKFTFDNDKVPVMSIQDYLKSQYSDGDLVHRRAEEVYKEVLEKSAAEGKVKEAEQDGAEQPATAPDSKPEGSQRPKPESEVRPQ